MMKSILDIQPLILLALSFLSGHVRADSACANLVCLNGGTCYTQIVGETVRNEYCICPPDRTGDTCADRKPCDLNCVHGQCQYPFSPAGDFATDDVDREPFCKCDDGFSGILCEAKTDECPDGKRSCYNGGQCQELFHKHGKREGEPFATPKYTCDCSTIDPKSPFAGLECQHPAEKICSLMTVNKTSFCVNGGTCKDIVSTENVHRGCNCLPGFEGDHCEFEEGTDPNNPKYSKSTEDTHIISKKPYSTVGLSGVEIFFLTIGCITTFILGVMTARRLKRKKDALKEAKEAYDENDLAFDADGNRMTNISINGDPAERDGEVI